MEESSTGTGVISAAVLGQQEESSGQPQAPCSLQAASEKVLRQLSIGEAEDFGLDGKEG